MLTSSRAVFTALVALAATLLFAAPATAAPAVDGEFPVAGGFGTNNYITEGPDGNMWATTESNTVAKITPEGVVTEYPIPNSGTGIAAGPDGNLWIATTVGVTKVPPGDPTNEQAFNAIGLNNGQGIVAGPDGRMWVAGTDELISFDPADPENTEDENAKAGMDSRGMTVGTDGLLWVAGNNGIVYSATAAADPVFTEYNIQIAANGGAQDVAAGLGGQVAYGAPTTDPHSVGRIIPGGTALQTQLETSDPIGITFGADGAYWVARSSTNDLLRLTADGQTTTLSGFSPVVAVGPRKIAAGPNDTLWVTLDDQSAVARVTGVAPPVTEADTVLGKTPKKKLKAKDKKNGKKGKAKAKFVFSSATPGATFECSLQKKGKGAKFKTCESPAKYKLKPGKYQFEVRAVLAGSPDASPETFAFKVVRKKR